MTAELYLIAPIDAEPFAFADALGKVLATTPVPVLLLPRGNRGPADYRGLVNAVLPVAQANGCAVVVEGDPADARSLGADGLHVTGPARAVKEAVGALKPNMIVGAGGIRTRHDAMEKGELGVDYVMFGPLSGPSDGAARDLGAWWAETMEVPSVLSVPEAGLDGLTAGGCEFVALSNAIWDAADPAEAATAAVSRLEALP
jgi:thiamine-phosphate pyrophosphorylase